MKCVHQFFFFSFFSLFINELTKDIIESGKHGIQLAPDLIEWLILLFDDDVVLLSDSVFGLQTLLNVLFNTAKRLDMIVNLDKSNIVVFRNGGHLALNEKWCFGNEELEVVNTYKYLGVYFSTRLTFSPTLNDLADRARKEMLAIMNLIDCFKQDWHAALGSHDFYNVYSNFSQSLVLSQYLQTLNNISVRRVFTRFRFGMSILKCHYLQYRSFARDRNINCPFCNTPETEVLFLLVCPKHIALRDELIPPKYHRQPSMFKFSLLLARTNAPTEKLSIFVFKALNTRKLSLRPSLDP